MIKGAEFGHGLEYAGCHSSSSGNHVADGSKNAAALGRRLDFADNGDGFDLFGRDAKPIERSVGTNNTLRSSILNGILLARRHIHEDAILKAGHFAILVIKSSGFTTSKRESQEEKSKKFTHHKTEGCWGEESGWDRFRAKLRQAWQEAAGRAGDR